MYMTRVTETKASPKITLRIAWVKRRAFRMRVTCFELAYSVGNIL